MEEAFPMKGGDSDYSYANNSESQKLGFLSVKEMIQEAVITNLDPKKVMQNTITIADLGCSIGPNTFLSVQTLIEAVQNKISSKTLEFQVFFNDHSTNDFNTLLTSLPPERAYHAAAAPGSFHGRLFPRNSITIAHSSYALNWLSKQPKIRNEGRIHYTGAAEEVVTSYSDQFETDLGVFLAARGEEIVSGGLLFVIMPVTFDSASPAGINFQFDYLGERLMDLVNEGVVEKAAVDGFNLPIYVPAAGEVRGVVERDGGFSVEREAVMNPWPEMERPDMGTVVMHLRAALEGVFAAKFGESVIDGMFAGVLGKKEELARVFESVSKYAAQLFLVLKRK